MPRKYTAFCAVDIFAGEGKQGDMAQKAKVIAIYSLKGGVGKTTLAVNLAAESALRREQKTLLWDLDPQSAASFILGHEPEKKPKARSVFERDIEPDKLITSYGDSGPRPAPRRHIVARPRRIFVIRSARRSGWQRSSKGISSKYDRIFLDCPPGLTETSEQMMRAADIIIVPVIPSPLSQRALDDVVAHLKEHHKGHAPLLPVFSMVDRRRNLHVAAMSALTPTGRASRWRARSSKWPCTARRSASSPIARPRAKLSICYRARLSVSFPKRRTDFRESGRGYAEKMALGGAWRCGGCGRYSLCETRRDCHEPHPARGRRCDVTKRHGRFAARRTPRRLLWHRLTTPQPRPRRRLHLCDCRWKDCSFSTWVADRAIT